ncbi:MAG: hypothetical protein IT379_42960, partial [Deltaproteobacteria bacterium]|nr:hypothetical protein [Deltaproteobacteria bacterium]
LDPPNGAGTFPSRVEVGGDANRFQARYAMLHRWEEPIACESPIAGTWHAPRGARPEAAVELLSAASVATPLERLLASPMSAVRARRLGVRAR